MADMLKFRKGTYAQIQAATKVPGTIYIAKDEKAMYVDIDTSENGRIRIGDFIRVDSVKDITPPYSTSSLYYVENDNALLKYDGSAWKQVNGTDDLKDRIKSVEDRASAVEGRMTTAEGKITTAEGKITALETAVGVAKTDDAAATGLHADIEALKAAVGMNAEGEVESLAGSVAQLRTDLTTAEGEIDALQELTQSHTGKISALETASAQHVTKAEAEAFAKTADIQGTLAKVDTDTGVKAAIEAAVAVEESRAKEAELALTNAVSAANGEIEKRVTNTAFDQFKTENTAAIGTAKTEAIEAAEDYADGLMTAEVTRADNKYATKASLEATNGVVSGHTSSISTINETLATKADKSYVDSTFVTKAAADAKLEKIDTTKKVSEAIAEAVAAEADRADKAEKANANAISKLQGDLADVKATADAAVTDGDLADAIKDFATTSYVDQAEADAVKESTRLGDLAYAPIGLVQTVNSINGTIGNTEGGLIKDIADAKKAAENADDNAELRVLKTDFADFQTSNTAVINAAKKIGEDAATQAETNRQAIATINGTVNKLNGDVNTDGSVKKQIKDATDALKTELSAEIDADIRSANAMTFKGIINSQSDFEKITEAQIGDTYVIGTAFGNYQAGDFLIAKGEENEVTGNIISIDWNHVKSGYDASLDQKLTGADNKIKLSTGTGLAGTEIAFDVAKDENGKPTSSAAVSVANNTVTVGMVWEDFE